MHQKLDIKRLFSDALIIRHTGITFPYWNLFGRNMPDQQCQTFFYFQHFELCR